MSSRYTIYKLIGRRVRFNLPARLGRKSVSGNVRDVYRDPFDLTIDIDIGGKVYRFREPEQIEIVEEEDEIVIELMYGTPGKPTDEEFSEAMEKTGSADEAFREIARSSYSIRMRATPTPVGLRSASQKKAKRKRKSSAVFRVNCK